MESRPPHAREVAQRAAFPFYSKPCCLVLSRAAQFILGGCYERSTSDALKAIVWYELAAAAAGDPPGAPQARAALARLRAARQ